MVEDYLKEEERKLNCCVAKIQNVAEKIDESVYTSLSEFLVNFECTCPKANKFDGNCSDEEFLWECDDCGQFLAIQNQTNQFGDYFYCQCGRNPVENIQFRCKYKDQHGSEFLPFPRETLGSIFGQFNFGEKNILILGETGVGKSTWINALANYMTYRNLDDALQMDNPICLIPSQFTIADEKMNSKLVQIGQADENGDEILKIGKSATKRPKAHIFPYKGGKIRLIDTPGIGDTEGIDEDKANFASTLSYIANFEELHGICILLKPNNARLSLIFRYCVNELLTHLHKNAARNINFCFTNTRATLFKPGDTLASLKELLDQMEQNQGVRIELNPDTVFCMDNEAFRFICAARNNIKFDGKDQANFADSWRRSETETNRLLARINSLTPHTTKETVSLNEARRIITTLSQPIASIAKIIQDNITKMADEKKRLATLTEAEVDLQKKLMTPFIYIKYIILPFPQTICGSKTCTEMRIDPNGTPYLFNKSICHDVCFDGGRIENQNQFSNQLLRSCMIFRESKMKCSICGCPWFDHVSTQFKQMECTEMVEDVNVKKWLEEGKDKKVAIQMAIQNASKLVKLFEAEQRKINEIAARFGAFLKRHALMSYNDAIQAYVELAIRDAKQIAEETKDFRKVEGLEVNIVSGCALGSELNLRNYKEQGRIIDESLKHGTEEIKPEDIKRYFNELVSLKLMGRNIKQLFDAETIAQKKQMAYHENSCTPPPFLRRRISNVNIRNTLPSKSPECSRKDAEKLVGPSNKYGELLSPDKTLFVEENLAKTSQKEQSKTNEENGSNSADNGQKQKKVIEAMKQKMEEKEEDDVMFISVEKGSKNLTQKSLAKRKNVMQKFVGNLNAADSKRAKSAFNTEASNAAGCESAEYVLTKAYPTYLNFCECTPDVNLQNGSMVYPWQSLPNDQIHLAYDMIPDTKSNNAANAAARSLILFGMNQYQNMPWGDRFKNFSEECTKMTRNGGENCVNELSNPSPWTLSDFMKNFMEKARYGQFIARVYTYNVFQDCARAIAEDIRGNKPVLICYSVKKQNGNECHYANVIAIKCEAFLPNEFVLLTVDRTIEHRCYENLKHLFGNEIDENMKENENGEQTKKFHIIRFQRKY